MMPTIGLLLLLLALLPSTALFAQSSDEHTYFEPRPYGSDSLYTPASAFFSYTLDTLQLPDNFDLVNYNDDLRQVWHQLRHPRRAIDEEGGWRRFVNREIFPIDSDHERDSFAALPNYTLHLLGDGMAYRRDVEWFRVRQHPYPRLAAAVIAMVSEVLQEGLEADNTTDADAIADVYLFRPLGILLFSQDRFARAVRRLLNPSIWPTLMAWDVRNDEFLNTGIAYVYRPPALRWGTHQLFIHTGFNNLFGLSRTLANGNTLSLGIGAAVEEIVRQRNIQADLRPSLGLFYDRHGSLLWSAVLNDTGNRRFRLNVYPHAHRWLRRTGWFFSIGDDRDVAGGIVYRWPVGIGGVGR